MAIKQQRLIIPKISEKSTGTLKSNDNNIITIDKIVAVNILNFIVLSFQISNKSSDK